MTGVAFHGEIGLGGHASLTTPARFTDLELLYDGDHSDPKALADYIPIRAARMGLCCILPKPSPTGFPDWRLRKTRIFCVDRVENSKKPRL